MTDAAKEKKLIYLLVMPRLIQTAEDGYSFPLGIAYISSSMKKAGFNVVTINLNHREGTVRELLEKEIKDNKIDVVATGGLSFQYSTIRDVVKTVKEISPGITTIVGGGIITGDPEPAMEALTYADIGVIGEGEDTIIELSNALECGSDIYNVNGLIYKKDKKCVTTPQRREMDNIESVPWPDYNGFDMDKYLASTPPGISGLNEKNTIFMLASRSCPYNCTFCFHTIGKKYRQRSIDDFFNELDVLTSKYDIRFICMADELFARKVERVREFCTRIKKYNVRWWAQFRVDDITPEILDLLKDGGCEVMSFGLESADDTILKSMRKGITVEQIEKTLKLVYDSGISLEGAFIFGDIEETAETANNTLTWWRKHSQFRITLNLITVFPGSYLYKYACEKGIIKDKVQFLKDGCPQVNVSKLSDSEMSDLVMTLMEAPLSQTKRLDSIVLNSLDGTRGRISVSGKCTACGQENTWDTIKLFATNFLPCERCGQKYNIPVPPEVRANIDANISGLLKKHEKVAVWGINYYISDLFKNSTVLQNKNVFPVDISETKRRMDLYGKKIHSPDIIKAEDIKVVVIAIPVYFTQISSQIATKYKGVTQVIDICHLSDKGYGV